MMITLSGGLSFWAVLGQKVCAAMDVILHLGAHRCATTSFQDYIRRNADGLAQGGVGFWGPLRTRNGGVLSGVMPRISILSPQQQLQRARGRILTQIEGARTKGITHLLVSDENILGTMRRNLTAGSLYGDVGMRLAQYHAAFDGRITRIALSIRSLENFWASSVGFGVARGLTKPGRERFEQIARNPRSWRDVITDVACAMPDVDIVVMPFETNAGRPEAKLRAMIGAGINVPLHSHRQWLNRTPNKGQLGRILSQRGTPDKDMCGIERWQPFDSRQIAQLRENYQDDLYWLYAGADGLARLTEETRLPETRINLAGGHPIKGQRNGTEKGTEQGTEQGRVA